MSSGRLERLRGAIGVRLALWYSGFFVLAALLLLALASFLLASSLRQRDHESIQANLRELTAQYEAGGVTALRKELALESAALTTRAFFVRLADSRNATVLMEIPDEWADFDVGRLEGTSPPSGRKLIRVPAHDDEAVLEVASSRLSDGGLLQVGQSTDERADVLERFWRIVAAVAVPTVLLGALGGGLLAVRALRPIRQLIHTVRMIESGSADARVLVRGTRDELDELALLFNRMQERIGALVQGMRAALDNVAHDLRTPVARIRGLAEVALRAEEDPAGLRDALADCVEECDRLLEMLNTLMDISEAETGALRLDVERVNVVAVLADVVEMYRDVAEDKGVTVTVAAPDTLWLTADRRRLRQIFANLLDNALKYTAGGGRVELGATREARSVLVSVKDDGAGIAPADLPRIWDRLYRGDVGRAQRGLGLGLSLVKAVVEAHGGHVRASSALGVGSTFTVSLPASPDEAR